MKNKTLEDTIRRNAENYYHHLHAPLRFTVYSNRYELRYRGWVYSQKIPFTENDIDNIVNSIDNRTRIMIMEFTNPVFIDVFSKSDLLNQK